MSFTAYIESIIDRYFLNSISRALIVMLQWFVACRDLAVAFIMGVIAAA